MAVFVEDWAATYGSPYLVWEDDTGNGTVELVEDRELTVHRGAGHLDGPVAFVDGVRRGEATLYLMDGGLTARAVAGAHGCGAVLAVPERRCGYDGCAVRRMVIWGSGCRAALPAVKGGWSWSSHSVANDDPAAPLQELQRRMREAEGRLAEELCGHGYLAIVDGPLNFIRSRDLPVVGLVKTHYRALLAPDQHARVPSLAMGERTSLFRKREDIYSAYLRLAPRSAMAGPWAGIVRIELPASTGLREAIHVADRVAASLPRYAGVAHIDPRAPQNLQPIGALETHLRHLLSDPGLAARAVRTAVACLDTTQKGSIP
jgi:hypothetical protein